MSERQVRIAAHGAVYNALTLVVALPLQNNCRRLAILGPACGPRERHRKPAAATQAGYAYCQLRKTQTVSTIRLGCGPRKCSGGALVRSRLLGLALCLCGLLGRLARNLRLIRLAALAGLLAAL